MTFVTKRMAGAVVVVSMLIGCGVPTEESDQEPEALGATQQAQAIGGNTVMKRKGDLEADGFTCKLLEGTTMTLCTKWGSKSWSCDPQGRCLENLIAPPKPPIFVGPVPTVVAPRSP